MDNESNHRQPEISEQLANQALDRELGLNALVGATTPETTEDNSPKPDATQEARIDETERPAFTVELIEQLDMLMLTNKEGIGTLRPTGLSRREVAAKFATLMQLRNSLNTGESYNFRQAAEAAGLTLEAVIGLVRKFATHEFLPKSLLRIEKQGNVGTIEFGDVAITKRDVLPSDIEMYDAGKLDIARHDHAIIKLGSERIFLPLHEKELILTAHVLHVLSSLKGQATADEITNIVWQNMTTTERRSMVKTPNEVFGQSSKIATLVTNVLSHLTNQLGITRQVISGTFQLLRNDASITLSHEPLHEHDPLLGSATPAGVSKEALKKMMAEAPLSGTDIAKAQEIIATLLHDDSIDQERAIAYFNLIVEPGIKRALKAAAKKTPGLPTTSAALRDMIEAKIAASLREGHEGAAEQRTIAGRSWLRHINLTGGELPGTSKRIIEKIDTKRWRVVRPGKNSH